MVIAILKINIIKKLEVYISKNLIDEKRFSDKITLQIRCKNLAKFIFGINFYTIMSIWGIYICINEKWFPYSLGGNGNVKNGFDGYPKISDGLMEKGIKWYYLIQLAYRIEVYLYLNLMNSEPKYWEYSLHHLLAIFTVCISYYTNFINTGTLTFILHDVSDVFMQISRGYNDYKHRREMIIRINGILNIIAWFLYRIVEQSLLVYYGYLLVIF